MKYIKIFESYKKIKNLWVSAYDEIDRIKTEVRSQFLENLDFLKDDFIIQIRDDREFIRKSKHVWVELNTKIYTNQDLLKKVEKINNFFEESKQNQGECLFEFDFGLKRRSGSIETIFSNNFGDDADEEIRKRMRGGLCILSTGTEFLATIKMSYEGQFNGPGPNAQPDQGQLTPDEILQKIEEWMNVIWDLKLFRSKD